MTTYRWRGLEAHSVEHLELGPDRDGGVRARSVVTGPGESYGYEIAIDRGWVFRLLLVRAGDGTTLELTRDLEGAWIANGQPRPDIAGAVDIDLAFSPFTNTLPIRRLGLAIGAAAEIATAYVAPRTLEVSRDPQRYTRLAADRYRYESLDSDFTREIRVDADGFVLDYPGLFVADEPRRRDVGRGAGGGGWAGTDLRRRAYGCP